MKDMTVKMGLVTNISKKTGGEYTVLEIHFPNGYVHKVFMNDEQKFIINQALAK